MRPDKGDLLLRHPRKGGDAEDPRVRDQEEVQEAGDLLDESRIAQVIHLAHEHRCAKRHHLASAIDVIGSPRSLGNNLS